MLFGNPLTGILINIERVVVKVRGVTHLQLLHLIFFPAVFSSAHPNAALGAAVASVTLPPIAALLRARARVADMRQAEPDLVLIQPVFISLSLPRTRKHARTRSHALPRFVFFFFFLRAPTVRDGVERFPASVEGFQQLFGLVLGGFHSALQPGHALCVPYKHAHAQKNGYR